MKFLINEHKTSVGFLLSLCLLFTFFPFVTAEIVQPEISDVFEVNNLIVYSKPCINNGTYCTSSAICNYTFYDNDNTILFNNVLAENVGADGASIWQFNLSQNSTGLYKVDMVCLDFNNQGSETLYYEVTGDGLLNSLAFYIIILAIGFGIIILGFSLKDAPITIFGSFVLFFVSLYTLFNGIAGTKDPVTTWAIGLILLGISMYVSVRSAYELIVD